MGLVALGLGGGGVPGADESEALAADREAASTWIVQAESEPEPADDTSGQEHEALADQLADLRVAIEAQETASAEQHEALTDQLDQLGEAILGLDSSEVTRQDLADEYAKLESLLVDLSEQEPSSDSESQEASLSDSMSSDQSGTFSVGEPCLTSGTDLSSADSWDWEPASSPSECSYLVHDPTTLALLAKTRRDFLLAASLIVMFTGATFWVAARDS